MLLKSDIKAVLVTGVAGFVGFHTAKKLHELGYFVVGVDIVNDYYDVNLKIDRLRELGVEFKNDLFFNEKTSENFKFYQIDLTDKNALINLFDQYKFDVVINLAASAGVRHSITHPHDYLQNNVIGFMNILENCHKHQIKHLVYASSSSVYGLNTHFPFSVNDNTDHPMSIYAATKKSNELMAHAYSSLYSLPTTGLRFFSVYGPWGRPDMALFIFTQNILKGLPIDVYNNGEMMRDFTYVDDIVNGIYNVMLSPPTSNPDWNSFDKTTIYESSAPYKVMNIGNNNPINLLEFIEEIEKNLKRTAVKNYLPMQIADVPSNVADVQILMENYNYKPSTNVKDGIKKFIDWYLQYYKVTL